MLTVPCDSDLVHGVTRAMAASTMYVTALDPPSASCFSTNMSSFYPTIPEERDRKKAPPLMTTVQRREGSQDRRQTEKEMEQEAARASAKETQEAREVEKQRQRKRKERDDDPRRLCTELLSYDPVRDVMR